MNLMINTSVIIALPHSDPISGSNTQCLQIGLALAFNTDFQYLLTKVLSFWAVQFLLSMFHDSTPFQELGYVGRPFQELGLYDGRHFQELGSSPEFEIGL